MHIKRSTKMLNIQETTRKLLKNERIKQCFQLVGFV